MNVLVLNAGSSTLKFQLVRTDTERMAADRDERLARGSLERIGGEAVYAVRVGTGSFERGTVSLRDHRAALEFILRWLVNEAAAAGISQAGDIEAVGHRVTHGGERFRRSVLGDDEVLRGIEETIELAPLHNPHNLRGYSPRAERLVPECRRSPFSTRRSTTRSPSARTCTRSRISSIDGIASGDMAFTARPTATSRTAIAC